MSLEQVLKTTRDEGEAQRAREELEEICDQLLQRNDEAATDAERRGLLLPLFRALAARGVDEKAAMPDREAWLTDALEFARSLGDVEVNVRAELLLGGLEEQLGRVHQVLERSRRVLREFPAARLRPFVLYQAATAADGLGEYTTALDWLDELDRTLPQDSWVAELRCQSPNLRAQVCFSLGLLDVSARLARQGRACLSALPSTSKNHRIILDVHGLNVEQARGRHDLVAQEARRALEDPWLYPPGSKWRGSMLGLLGSSLLELERRDPRRVPAGEQALREALECEPTELDRAQIEITLARMEVERSGWDAAERRIASARERMRSWGATGPLPQDLRLAVLAARLARGSGKDPRELAASRDELQRALEQRIELWAALSPVRRAGTGFLHDPDMRAVLVELARLDGALGRDGERTLESTMAVQAQGSILRAQGGAAGTLAEVRAELLEPARGMLVYLPGPHASVLVILDRDGAQVVELAPEHRLQESPTAEELLPERAREALERWRGGVTVVGADLLGDPPFAALALDDGTPLGLARALDVLPSLPMGLHLARQAQAAGPARGDLVVLASPEVDPALEQRFRALDPLPWSAELAAAFRPPPGGRTRILAGSEATLEGLRAALEEAGALQFLTHCVQDDRLERSACLVLAPSAEGNGLVTSDALAEFSAPPLVVLAACGASLGPRRAGDEGSGHLGGALLQAGARTVLLARDDLEFESARLLSADFLDAVFAGRSPAEALRTARVQARAQGRDPLLGSLALFGLNQRALYPALEVPSIAEDSAGAEDASGEARTTRRPEEPRADSRAVPRSEREEEARGRTLELAAGALAAAALALGALALWLRRRSG